MTNMKRRRSAPPKKLKGLQKLGIILFLLIAIIYATVFLGHRLFFKPPYSAKPTIPIIENTQFKLGAAAKKQPQNTKEYLTILAKQVKLYNQNLEQFWPDNPLKNYELLAQDISNKKASLISTKGQIKSLSKKEFKSYDVSSLPFDGQWAFFDSKDRKGAYVSIMPQNIDNFYYFQKYEHLGTYDQFLSYNHELFHKVTQERWAETSFTDNNREERLEDKATRRQKMLLQQQLKLAISEENHREKHIKNALATYQDYRESSPKDYKEALLYDRLEGTAYYYELLSSLFASYPEQVTTHEEALNALKLLMADDNPAYRMTGLISEGYSTNAFAGILLDLLALEKEQDPNQWKMIIEKQGDTTPLLLLEKEFSNEKLPIPSELPSEKDYEDWVEENRALSPNATTTENIFTMLYHFLY